MPSDPLWPQLLVAVLLFFTGALLSVAIKPWGRVLATFWNAILRVTHIDSNAGHKGEAEAEIRALMDQSEEKGAIAHSERELIENVFEFNNMTAEDVMIHRTDMVMIWTGDTDEEVTESIASSGLSRFPVYEEDADDIVGILSTRDYLMNARQSEPKPLQALLRDAYFVPESVPTDILFRDMQTKKIHMAMIVDEYGGTSGLVTMEDLLEELVGNIYDEFDPLEDQEIIKISEGLFRVAGVAELEELEKVLDMTLPETQEFDTLGGLVFDQLSMIPEDGSKFEVTAYGLHIRVEEFLDRRVEWALVSKQDRQKSK